MNFMHDRKLVEAVLSGKRQAVRRLYGVVEMDLRRYFLSKTQCGEDAEELIQDTFLHVLDALPLFRFQSSLKTFVMGIARHELMDYWRKLYAKRVIRTIPIVRELMSVPLGKRERISRTMHEALEAAYGAIDPEQAQVLRLKYEECLSVKHISELLGKSVKATEALLYRSRKAFQAAYVPVEEYY
jgi:RNA polymerase sigma-70 factor (ECF subfamily)